VKERWTGTRQADFVRLESKEVGGDHEASQAISQCSMVRQPPRFQQTKIKGSVRMISNCALHNTVDFYCALHNKQAADV
jgi:hypothetical protein